MWDVCDPCSGPPMPVKSPTNRGKWQTCRDIWKWPETKRKILRRRRKQRHQVPTFPLLRSYRSFYFYTSWESAESCDTDTHIYTRLGNEKSSVKTWIRIWWAHRERWNASACSVPAQCKQPAHVCACLPPLKLLSISPRCPFLLIQTFVPPATTDAIPPQDFIHKHSIRIPRLQPASLRVQLSSPSCCKESSLGFRWVLHSHEELYQKSLHTEAGEDRGGKVFLPYWIINYSPLFVGNTIVFSFLFYLKYQQQIKMKKVSLPKSQ